MLWALGVKSYLCSVAVNHPGLWTAHKSVTRPTDLKSFAVAVVGCNLSQLSEVFLLQGSTRWKTSGDTSSNLVRGIMDRENRKRPYPQTARLSGTYVLKPAVPTLWARFKYFLRGLLH